MSAPKNPRVDIEMQDLAGGLGEVLLMKKKSHGHGSECFFTTHDLVKKKYP